MSKRRKYNLNENYFNKIDSEDKAYFLGLLFSDGYNHSCTKNKYVAIGLNISDKYILDTFQCFIGSNYPIKIRHRNNENHSDLAHLQLNSNILSNDLTKLGCVQNKTYIVEFPSKEILPYNLTRHFVRGYFDGNGCVWEGERKTMIVKDKLYKSGYRERIIHNVKFNITGSYMIISHIQNILVECLGFSKTKLNNRNDNISTTLEYSGRLQMKKFYEYIYKDSSIYLNRKKDKFESILNIL